MISHLPFGVTGDAFDMWEIATGHRVIHLGFDSEEIMAISPDCKYLASKNQVLEIATGDEIMRLTHGGAPINSVAFSPDSKYVVSTGACDSAMGIRPVILGCGNGSMKVWDITTGKEITQMALQDAAYTIALSPNGKYITTRRRNTISVWIWRAEDLIANTCLRLPRNLSRAEWKQYVGDTLQYELVCPNLPEATATSTPTPMPSLTPAPTLQPISTGTLTALASTLATPMITTTSQPLPTIPTVSTLTPSTTPFFGNQINTSD